MYKKLSFFIIFLAIVSLASYIGYSFYYYKAFLSNFSVVTEDKDPIKYPYVSWNAITSGRLAKFVRNEDKAGRLEKLSDKAIPFSNFTTLNDQAKEQLGIDFPIPTNTKLYLDNADIEARPYEIVAIFRTGLGRKNYIVLINRIKNNDGSVVFIPLLISSESFVNKNSEYKALVFDKSKNNFESSVLNFKNKEACIRVYPDRKTYCEWLFKKQKRLDLLNKILQNILRNSNFSNELEKIPTIMKLIVLT